MTEINKSLTLTIESCPSEANVSAVCEGLLAFNIKHVGQDPQSASVNLFLRDGLEQVVGGLLGWWRWRWLYVDKLWAQDSY